MTVLGLLASNGGNVQVDVSFWTAIANVVLASVTLFLLFQGQRDRRLISIGEVRSQAERTSLSVQPVIDYETDGVFSVRSLTIRIRNDSDLPVTINAVALFVPETTQRYYAARSMNLEDSLPEWLEPPENLLRPHAEMKLEGFRDEQDAVRLEFADARGKSWVRLSNNGRLYEGSPEMRWWQRAYQALANIPGLHLILNSWPNQYAFWRASKTNKTPLTARWIRFWWGYMPVGDPLAWDRPDDWEHPKEWPYEMFLGLARDVARRKRLERLIRPSRSDRPGQ